MKFSYRYYFLTLITVLSLTIYGCSDSSSGPGNGNGGGDFNSEAAPGASAEAFLRADTYTSLNLEIDYMPGQEPTQRALDSLKTFLQQRLNKPASITLRTPTEIPAGGQQQYSADEIRSLEEQNRDNYTQSGTTLEAYFIIVDGKYEQQDNVLGIAYYNTSMAFFGQTIEEISGGATQPPTYKVEGAVFRHEFGHNMGLVGNGTEVQSPHKTEGSAHCTNDGCLMEPEVRTTDFFANLFDGDIPNLEQFCIQDLQANGGK